jgi:hypothetical protein
MRVGIYAYGPTTVRLTGSATLLTFSPVVKERSSKVVQAGQHSLTLGIYLILPAEKCAISVTGDCDVVVLADKDDWPDPKGQLAGFDANFPEVDYKSLKEFVSIAKGLQPISA